MPKKPNYTAAQIEALNRKMEHAVAVHLTDGVRRLRTDMGKGQARAALHDAIRSGDFSRLDGHIPYAGFDGHVAQAADKIASLGPRTRGAVRAGIKGGITGPGRNNALLTRPLNFDAALPGKTAAVAGARSALHAQVKRTTDANRFTQGEVRARMRSYMRDLLGPQKRSITRAVKQGVEYKLSMPEVTAQIRNKIGLTERQQLAVEKTYSSALGAGLSNERAQELSDAHSERLLDYRAETIAVTETRTLSETIKQSEWLTAEGDGMLGDNPTVTWMLGALDDKTCPVCIAADGTQMPLGSMFTLTNGIECLPGFAHPRCRCYSMLTTDDDGDEGRKGNVDSRDTDFSLDDEDADAMASRA